MKMNHTEKIDAWVKEGKKRGYHVTKEFKIDDSNDSIDCVWKKKDELIFIEVEAGKFNNQVWKNMTKALHLGPSKIIFDCKYLSTAKQIKKRVNRVNIPIELSLWTNKGLCNKLINTTKSDLIKLKKIQKEHEFKRMLESQKKNQQNIPPPIYFELKHNDLSILKKIYFWNSEDILSLYSLYPYFKEQFSKRTLSRRLHHLEKLNFIELQQSVILLIKTFENMGEKVNELIRFHENSLIVKTT